MNLMSLIDKKLVGSVFAGGDGNGLDDDRGFGKAIKWKMVGQGFEEARKTSKPICLVVHRDTCPACQKLKIKFSQSSHLAELSNQFVMINVPSDADVLSVDKKFQPDGKYVPRILFYTSDGINISDAYNRKESDSKYRYFYSSPSEITLSMKYVIEGYKTS